MRRNHLASHSLSCELGQLAIKARREKASQVLQYTTSVHSLLIHFIHFLLSTDDRCFLLHLKTR